MVSDSFIPAPTTSTHDGTHGTSQNTDLVLSRRASQTEPTAVTPSALSFPVTLRVVFQGSHSRFYLHHVCLLASDTGDTVMRKLQEIYFQESSRIPVFCGTYVSPYKPVVEIANLSTIHHSDNNTLYSRREVIVASRQFSHELTTALQRPDLLSVNPVPVLQNPIFLIALVAEKAILVGRTINRKFIIWTFITGLTLSLVVGVIVGLVSRNAGLGVACGAVIVGVISVVEALIFWQAK